MKLPENRVHAFYRKNDLVFRHSVITCRLSLKVHSIFYRVQVNTLSMQPSRTWEAGSKQRGYSRAQENTETLVSAAASAGTPYHSVRRGLAGRQAEQ